jgi:hypothetical protein
MRPASGSRVGIVLFQEFERYIGHAHMKLRKPMRDERVGNQAEGPAPPPPPSSAPATVAPTQRPATPPPSPRALTLV